MAEYSAAHHAHLHRRRQSANLAGSTPAHGVHFGPDQNSEPSLADKAQEYDRALRRSQVAASRRKAGLGAGSILAASGVYPSGSSIFEAPYLARTAILGDSQGSIAVQEPSGSKTSNAEPNAESVIPIDDLAPDGGVGSGLGESYVDGAKRSRNFEDTQENEDPIEDVGLLGLLAQVYGRRDAGPARVM